MVLVGCDAPDAERELLRVLTARARLRGFAAATLSLATHPLEALDQIVRGWIEGLTVAGRARAPGLTGLLEAYAARHPKGALAAFDAAVARRGAVGDLTSLCRGLLDPATAAASAAAFSRWLQGLAPGCEGSLVGVRGALNERSARRVLAELTRLVRCLGHGGTMLCLTQGDRIGRRSPGRRERAYTLLRELIDNFDGGRGMISTRLMLTGAEPLFSGATSLLSLPALASRILTPHAAGEPPPHRSFTRLSAPAAVRALRTRDVLAPEGRRAMRSLIRVAQGLPPTEAVAAMTVGHERIDELITRLLDHARQAGSVFSVLQGDYGTGKTHLLLHLADRALSAGHPVFRLNLERLNLDLGNPARHLHRLLADSELPAPRRPSALEWLAQLTRLPASRARLASVLQALAAERGDVGTVARRALRAFRPPRGDAARLEAFLAGSELEEKTGTTAHRRDAYSRLLLWIELLQRLERWQGPVLLIDEAENLYVSGISRVLRRTALRSLAFYCGGALPSACVVMTSTPRAFAKLKYEAGELLYDVGVRDTSLEWEDAAMLRHRLLRLIPQQVPVLTAAQRGELAMRVASTHALVRGYAPRSLPALALDPAASPRALVRQLVDELEASWWRERPTLGVAPGSSRSGGEPGPASSAAFERAAASTVAAALGR